MYTKTCHRPIHRFGFDGHLKDDADIIRLKENYRALIIEGMREDGYVPVLDLDIFWSTQYDSNKKRYTFRMTVYGVYVGKRKAYAIEGMVGQNRMYARVSK